MPDQFENTLAIVKTRAFGGVSHSAVNLARAETEQGCRIVISAWMQEQRDLFAALAEERGVFARTVGPARLAAQLSLFNVRRDKAPAVVRLHSGRALLSRNVLWLRRLAWNVPFITFLHGSSQLERITNSAQRQHLLVSRHVDAVAVPSEAERDRQLELGLNPDTTFVVPNIVPPPRVRRGTLRHQLGLSDETVVVGFCGRLVPGKGVSTAIAAFEQVAEQYADVVLVIAGSGPESVHCQRSADRLTGRVIYVGHLQEPDDLFVDADVVLVPSDAESFGRTAFEAAVAGAALVLSHIRPWTDFFDGRQACLFADPQNVSAWGRALDHLLRDLPFRRKIAANAQDAVAGTYGAEVAVRAVRKIYDSVY